MSSNSTNPITRKEMKECYKSLPKKRLVKLIVDKTIMIRELHEENQKLKENN